MKRKGSSTNKVIAHNSLNIPLSIITFFLGVIATFMITHVFAQTADTNQIYACVHNTNGNVRVVTSSDSCKQQEKSIKWSIQGPPGPQGPAGSTGGINQYFGLPFICNGCFLSSFADRFAGKDFSYAQIIKSDFSNSDLSGVKFKQAFLSSNNFTNANLTGSDLSDIRELSGGRIPQSNIFTGANLSNVNFSNSLLHDSNFTNTNLQNTNFSNSLIRRGNFTGAQNMSSANFTGTTMESVTCPDGTNSDTNSNTCDGHF